MRKFNRSTAAGVHPYQVKTVHGYRMIGKLGDGVDNRIAVHRDYEPGLSAFIARHASGTRAFLDIGCNVGWFSCLAASLPERPEHLFALDANPAMAEACRQNLAINQFQGEVELCALGPERGQITLHIPDRRHSRASVGRANAEGVGDTNTITVEMVPLVEILSRFPDGRCDLIKMDIEGFELVALRAVPRDVALKIGMIALEYTRENLEGCGFAGMTLGVLPWLDAFQVHTLDDDGRLHSVKDPADYSPDNVTFILKNRSWPA